jgi:hypothetical protein
MAGDPVMDLDVARGLLRELMQYRDHDGDCAVGMTEFCTCGMAGVATRVRAFLALSAVPAPARDEDEAT